nr:DegT/DnrJ/EryC1/StrS family aminotransferase [Rhizobium sp. CFBP 8762]
MSLTDRFDPVGPNETAFLGKAIETSISGQSSIVSYYEDQLREHFGVREAIAVSSGFGALVVALSAMGLEPGDKVLLTPTCPLCTAYALTFMRLEPVFCDICRDDFSMSVDHAAFRLDSMTRAIIDIPMWGYPIAADATEKFAKEHKLQFLVDVALAHQTKLHGQFLCKYAGAATFSTHSSKNIVTGEGGVVLTDDPNLASKARKFCHPNNPQSANPGLNYALGGLQAALGVSRLPRLESDVVHRQAIMRHITNGLDNPHLEVLPITTGGTPGGTKLIVREVSGNNRQLLRHQLDHGVPSDIANYNCKPLYEYPVFYDRSVSCPNAEKMLQSITTIPVHPEVDFETANEIIEILNSYRPAVKEGL